MINKLKEIQEYLLNNYLIESEILNSYDNKKELIFKNKQYNFRIKLTSKEDKNYLNGKEGIFLNYECKSPYHGGGSLEEFNYKNIDKFLEKFNYRKQTQLTIFDY